MHLHAFASRQACRVDNAPRDLHHLVHSIYLPSGFDASTDSGHSHLSRPAEWLNHIGLSLTHCFTTCHGPLIWSRTGNWPFSQRLVSARSIVPFPFIRRTTVGSPVNATRRTHLVVGINVKALADN